ncbi:plasmid partitioning protein RepB C-terminal domain-containing protein [Bradyrhizobium erythrophlei]|uniref:plasmid partitioning protein RepB C-terminal domain-containing protein n=1 Tax=Bradyrhizobium erythrophlei TaxID=1437360 RepID=UPI0023EA7021|nr:plasmid partitioning protein RepB C-terminal domain-containing protein [Bradyrhizobium erythrophlei]
MNANNYSVGYASAILAGKPQAQLVNSSTPKRIKRMTAEALSRMESELSRLQQAITSIQDTYGQDHLRLTVLRGYLAKLVGDTKIANIWRGY